MISVIAVGVELADWLLYQIHAYCLRREAREAAERLFNSLNKGASPQ